MMADPCSDPDGVVTEARRWLGTPYCHQASCRGVGTDCLGLMRGIWRAVVGPEPQTVTPYSPDWAEGAGDERLLEAARKHLEPVVDGHERPGDVLLFRMLERGPVKHVGVLVTPSLVGGRMIHAYSGHVVCETALTPAWARRLAGMFRFPGVAVALVDS